jgi:hypothetical protein
LLLPTSSGRYFRVMRIPCQDLSPRGSRVPIAALHSPTYFFGLLWVICQDMGAKGLTGLLLLFEGRGLWGLCTRVWVSKVLRFRCTNRSECGSCRSQSGVRPGKIGASTPVQVHFHVMKSHSTRQEILTLRRFSVHDISKRGSGGFASSTVDGPQIGHLPDPGNPVALRTCPISGPHALGVAAR